MRGSIGRALLRPLATIDHRATSLGPRCVIATRPSAIFFQKKEKRSGQAAARNGFRSNLEVCISALAHALHIEVD